MDFRGESPVLFAPLCKVTDDNSQIRWDWPGIDDFQTTGRDDGGKIGAHSAPGAGSAFWFTIVFEQQPKKDAIPANLDFGMQALKALIVDDVATNRTLMRTLLNTFGCRCEEAADENSALAALRFAAKEEDPFRVAFLDWKLPGTDGLQLGRQIVSESELHGISLVLMTPLGRECEPSSIKQMGFAGSLSKPVWESSLREALALSLRGRGREDSALEIAAPLLAVSSTTSYARILVVEDNLTNQQVALAILQKLGCRAEAVGNGEEALAALRQTEYDLVLMDCQMPVMDGFEAARRIRLPAGGVRNPAIPVIAVTAHAMTGDRERCLAAEMNDYISKPIEPARVAEMLSKWIRRPQSPENVGAIVSQPQSGSGAIFDSQKLVARLSGDMDLARKIVAGFLGDAPGQLQKLRLAIQQADVNGIRSQAHLLKGAADTVSALALRDLSMEILRAVADADLSRVASLAPGLEEQFEKLKTTVSQSGWA